MRWPRSGPGGVVGAAEVEIALASGECAATPAGEVLRLADRAVALLTGLLR